MLDIVKEKVQNLIWLSEPDRMVLARIAHKNTKLRSNKNAAILVLHMNHADAWHLGSNVHDVGTPTILREYAEAPNKTAPKETVRKRHRAFHKTHQDVHTSDIR